VENTFLGGVQVYSKNVEITNCTIFDSISSGIYIRGVYPKIMKNTIKDCRKAGIYYNNQEIDLRNAIYMQD
jgi:hypothetical protein